MKTYLAGQVGVVQREILLMQAHGRRLVAFAYVRGQWKHLFSCAGPDYLSVGPSQFPQNTQDTPLKNNKVELFLDSGAFSAWSQGVDIDIQDYIAFIKQHEKLLSVYAVLDVIGDAEGTLRNQRIMEDAGLAPLPCFHFGEPCKYLEQYVQDYDYMAIGGLAKMGGRAEMFQFLDKAFDIICDSKGIPQIKVHGFAVTNLRAMKRYPWYSVDSTSWLMTARMGCIRVPHKLPGGGWDYLEELPKKATRKIGVSSISPSSGEPDSHYCNISRQWRKEVDEWLDMHGISMGRSRFSKVKPGYELQEGERWAKQPGVGDCDTQQEFTTVPEEKTNKDYIEIVEEPGLCNDYIARDVINAMYFKELESKFPKYPWAWQRPRLRGFGF